MTDEIKPPAVLTETGQATLRRLLREWFEFERRLAVVPIIRRLVEQGFLVPEERPQETN